MITVPYRCEKDGKTLDSHEIAAEVRRRARQSGLKAGAVRKIEDKRRKPAKHKKPLRGDE